MTPAEINALRLRLKAIRENDPLALIRNAAAVALNALNQATRTEALDSVMSFAENATNLPSDRIAAINLALTIFFSEVR